MHKLLRLLAATAQILSFGQVQTWNVDAIHAPQLWPLTRGAGVNVVVVDTGIDYTHEELRAAYAGGVNLVDPNEPPYDDYYHGTHVAAIIAAADNRVGIVGVAPAVRLWSAKIFDARGNGDENGIIAALDWTIAQKQKLGGNWIVNMSFSDTSPPSSDALAAFRRASDAGILMVAAAGLSPGQIEYPAALPEVISVGAVDAQNQRSNLSSYGPGLSLVAPGVDVLSAVPTNTILSSQLQIPGELPIAMRIVAGAHQTTLTGILGSDIALVDRTSAPLADQVRDAMRAGAKAVIIANTNDSSPKTWSLDDFARNWPPVASLTLADAALVRPHLGETVTLSVYANDYTPLTGTSQAAPHVTGAAALLWSLAPTATAAQVRAALESTAHDLGPPGRDEEYGWGLIDADAAARALAPEAFTGGRRRRP
jgi:serine protease